MLKKSTVLNFPPRLIFTVVLIGGLVLGLEELRLHKCDFFFLEISLEDMRH